MGVMMRHGPSLIPDVGDLALFAGCNRWQRDRIRSLLTPIGLPADAVLIECGARPREFAVIADGEVAVTGPSGVELAVLGPGAIVGELGLLRDVPTCAQVTTLTPVVAYVGNRHEFVTMLETAPTVDHQVLHIALARLRTAA
jgi:CRP/FNR family transcriptional regulator, cyclic AMP receptor protein